MKIKTDLADEAIGPSNTEMVTWTDLYATGIERIDNQHKELVLLTNELFQACRTSQEAVEMVFKDAMHRMVDYVRFHFSTEQKLLEQINFPEYADHKKQHESLVKQILEAAKEFEAGKKWTPHNFVRTLKDWVFSHIAITDKIYAAYVQEEKKKGLLLDL